jgi:hypothetical protein
VTGQSTNQERKKETKNESEGVSEESGKEGGKVRGKGEVERKRWEGGNERGREVRKALYSFSYTHMERYKPTYNKK